MSRTEKPRKQPSSIAKEQNQERPLVVSQLAIVLGQDGMEGMESNGGASF